MSFSRVLSAAMCGMEVIPVQVEADVSNGLPLFHMVGYLGAEVREAEERVRTAIQNACAALPPKRMVINLSPGNVRKRGTSYDLPIALAVLAAAGLLQQECLEQVMAVGELGLDGSVQGIPGKQGLWKECASVVLNLWARYFDNCFKVKPLDVSKRQIHYSREKWLQDREILRTFPDSLA